MTIGLVRKIAGDLGVSVKVANRIASTASRKYKIFQIPKRRGSGYRTVAQPAREVKALQRSLVRFLSPSLPVHESATAYRLGGSIRLNAQVHAGANYLLKLDFESFFPSITAGSLSEHLSRNVDQISQAEVDFILAACLWRASPHDQLGLCIGAPSSPFLSNSVMYAFDLEVARYCEWIGASYSRYSDDLTFSSRQRDVLASVEQFVRGLVRRVAYPRLSINEVKRVSASRGTSMNVTGLVLSNDGGVTVGRTRKRGVRSGVNHYLRGRLSPEQVAKLKGELAFVLSIEPNFRAVLRETYGPPLEGLL